MLVQLIQISRPSMDVRYSNQPIDASNFAQATQPSSHRVYYGDVSPALTERAYLSRVKFKHDILLRD